MRPRSLGMIFLVAIVGGALLWAPNEKNNACCEELSESQENILDRIFSANDGITHVVRLDTDDSCQSVIGLFVGFERMPIEEQSFTSHLLSNAAPSFNAAMRADLDDHSLAQFYDDVRQRRIAWKSRMRAHGCADIRDLVSFFGFRAASVASFEAQMQRVRASYPDSRDAIFDRIEIASECRVERARTKADIVYTAFASFQDDVTTLARCTTASLLFHYGLSNFRKIYSENIVTGAGDGTFLFVFTGGWLFPLYGGADSFAQPLPKGAEKSDVVRQWNHEQVQRTQAPTRP